MQSGINHGSIFYFARSIFEMNVHVAISGVIRMVKLAIVPISFNLQIKSVSVCIHACVALYEVRDPLFFRL